MDKILEQNKAAEKEDFLKKKNPEKFKFIYDEIQQINGCIAELDAREECCCNCDENTAWIEKIKEEQRCFLERIEDLESGFYSFKEKILEINFIKEYLKMKKTIEKFEAEERTRRWRENKK